MGEFVFCLSCRTVIWGYDHARTVDMRGICNHIRLPCPACGVRGNFDGYKAVGWMEMRKIAEVEGLEWAISPDCDWFRRPSEMGSEHKLILLEREKATIKVVEEEEAGK